MRVRGCVQMRGLPAAALFLISGLAAQAQEWKKDLKEFAETVAVAGSETSPGGIVEKIRARVQKWNPQTDNLGNITVTIEGTAGAGPHRLIVAAMDEPGYIVSGITADGFLRLQRIPQGAAGLPPVFDQLHAAQPVTVVSRKGKAIPGVVAGLSTHLQGGRRDAPRGGHPDEMYVDIGASSAAGARRAGADLLDPVAVERTVYEMGGGKLAGASVGDKFGAAVLLELARRVEPARLKGKLTLAWVAQQWTGSRGLDRLTQYVKADEMVFVGRLAPRRPGPAGGGGQPAGEAARATPAPRKAPGSGVLIAAGEDEGRLEGLAGELKRIADENGIRAETETAAGLPRVSYTQGPVLPDRFTHIGAGVAWRNTPAELIDGGDFRASVELLAAYALGGKADRPAVAGTPEATALAAPAVPVKPKTAPATTEILRALVERYGVSGKEGPVREAIAALLPSWAKPDTDGAGNLILRLGKAGKGTKRPRAVFVAHSDEIGYAVRRIEEDGRLTVQSLGGGISEFFAGHTMFVHTRTGIRPGVMELPSGWNQPGFEWPRGGGGQQAGGQAQRGPRVDVGARSADEARQLGVEAGDTVTVPKKFRRLAEQRANGRSFDDRVGCTALVAAVWALGPGGVPGREVVFVWSTEEEVGLRGALAHARDSAAAGATPEYVFAVDTFVSSDSPLESERFARAEIGKGFVIRAADNSNITPRDDVDRLTALARANQIAVQYGTTGGGNDGAAYIRHGAKDIAISWPLRYSHSPGEVVDLRDVEALARAVVVIARAW